jgi:hypothetical protein
MSAGEMRLPLRKGPKDVFRPVPLHPAGSHEGGRAACGGSGGGVHAAGEVRSGFGAGSHSAGAARPGEGVAAHQVASTLGADAAYRGRRDPGEASPSTGRTEERSRAGGPICRSAGGAAAARVRLDVRLRPFCARRWGRVRGVAQRAAHAGDGAGRAGAYGARDRSDPERDRRTEPGLVSRRVRAAECGPAWWLWRK